MPALKNLFTSRTGAARAGEVQADLGNGYYTVNLNGRAVRVRSSSSSLRIGATVIVADTGDGLFIIGEEKGRGRSRLTVTITG